MATNIVTGMTNDTTPSPFVASASNDRGGLTPAYKAFDGVDAQRWEAYPISLPQWLKIDLGTAYLVGSYKLLGHTVGSQGSPKAWTLEGSSSGSFSGEQTTVDTQTNQTTTTLKTYTLASPSNFRYFRLNISSTDTDGNDLFVDTLELYTADVFPKCQIIWVD